MFTVGDSGKLPFEDRVVEYLRANEGKKKTVKDCAKELGIGIAAVHAVLANLEAKGLTAAKGRRSRK